MNGKVCSLIRPYFHFCNKSYYYSVSKDYSITKMC